VLNILTYVDWMFIVARASIIIRTQ